MQSQRNSIGEKSDRMTTPGRIIVTYADDYSVWPHIAEEVASRFPLRSLTFPNSRSQQGSRVVDKLEVEMRLYRPDMFPRTMIGASSPYFVHICFVNTEDTEHYKNTVKKQIQDWLNVVGNKKNQEWFIVYATASDVRKGQTPRFLNVGGSVFDRLKSDFTPKQDKLMHLKLSNLKDNEVWNEFFHRLKDAVISSFIKQVTQYEEDTRRLDAQRLKPGWNYCQYFILKEGLACTYEMMNINDEALVQYDELEAAFFQNLREQGAPWFTTFGGTDSGDDSNDILNINLKPYRDMILQNTITIFDFRIYLFARQVQLLFRVVNGPHEICNRAKQFIYSFARTIQEYKVSLIPYFGESWIYSSCLNVINHCDELLAFSPHSEVLVSEYENAKAELLHYARLQLDTLGIASKLFTLSIHSSSSLALPGPNAMLPPGNDSTSLVFEQSKALAELTNADIKNSLASEESFDALYFRITNRCISSFQACNKLRTVSLLKGDVALLHFDRRRYAEAAAIWEEALTNAKDWLSSETEILKKLAICQKELGARSKYVSTCLLILGKWDSLKEDGEVEYFVKEISENSRIIDEPIAVTQDTMLKVSVIRMINRVGDTDPVTVELEVHNVLSETLSASGIVCTLVSTSEEQFACSSGEVILPPGRTLVLLNSDGMVVPGTYLANHSTISIGKVTFNFDVSKATQRKVFKVVDNPSDLHVSIGIPEKVFIGEAVDAVLFSISVGGMGLQSGTLSISPVTELLLDVPKVIPCRVIRNNHSELISRDLTLDAPEGRITLPECNDGDLVKFTIPLLVDPLNRTVEHTMKLVVHYKTFSGANKIYYSVDKLRLTAPLDISHLTLLQPPGYFLQLQCTGIDQNPLCIVKVDVEPVEGVVELTPTPSMTVSPQQNVAYLYQFPDAVGEGKLQITFHYYSLVEEIGLFAVSEISRLLSSSPRLGKFKLFICRFFREHVLPVLDLSQHLLCGALDFALPDNVVGTFRPDLTAKLVSSLLFEDEGDRDALVSLFTEFLDSFKRFSVSHVRDTVAATSGTSLIAPLMKQLIYVVQPPRPTVIIAAEIILDDDTTQRSLVIGDVMQYHIRIKPVSWMSQENSLRLK